jgi:carotenoid cleavage dioxygenase-like enzyme
LPFGAHYRQDQDGSIWNIGYASLNDAIVLYVLLLLFISVNVAQSFLFV